MLIVNKTKSRWIFFCCLVLWLKAITTATTATLIIIIILIVLIMITVFRVLMCAAALPLLLPPQPACTGREPTDAVSPASLRVKLGLFIPVAAMASVASEPQSEKLFS